jgi:predicted MFS family arabinose efflux permease
MRPWKTAKGAAFGAVSAGGLSDRSGRRKTLMGLALIFVIATTLLHHPAQH